MPIDARKQWQIFLDFYEAQAKKHHGRYVVLKMIETMAAAAIPILALTLSSRVPAAVLGGVIAVAEGYLGIEKTQERWIASRKTAERLRLEGVLWLAGGGDYADSTEPDQLLLERLGSIMRDEQSEWLASVAKPMPAPDR